jgi:uncharacterized damage-inducible protein DinB
VEILRIEPFLDYYRRIRQRTMRVVAAIPPEHIEWRPDEAPGRWTLGDLLRHLGALERWMFAENVQGKPSLYQGCGRELAEGYEAVVAYLEGTHRETLEILGRLTPDDLQSPCRTPAGTPITVWKWLRAMVEHEIHHRGQIYLYLGLLGVQTPPLYGLTAEQVQERSEG